MKPLEKRHTTHYSRHNVDPYNSYDTERPDPQGQIKQDHTLTDYKGHKITEYNILRDFLTHGVELYFQQDKRRVMRDGAQLTLETLEMLTQDGQFRFKDGFNTIAVETKTLPANVVIIDIDNPKHAHAVLNYLAGMAQNHSFNWAVETTPRKGLHFWSKVIDASMLKSTFSYCGMPIEVFKKTQSSERITIMGPNRKHVYWVPLKDLNYAPDPLMPCPKWTSKKAQLPDQIMKGFRWTTINQLRKNNAFLNEACVQFIGNYVCSPPFEHEKIQELINLVNKLSDTSSTLVRGGTEEEEASDRESSIETRVVRLILPHLKEKWLFRVPESQWAYYNCAEKRWVVANQYEIENEIESWIEAKKCLFISNEKRTMSTRSFRTTIQKVLEAKLYIEIIRKPSVIFKNGQLFYEGNELCLKTTTKEDHIFDNNNIDLDINANLGEISKKYLMELGDGCKTKINLFRVFLSFIVRGHNPHQIALYVVGPGGSGKSVWTKIIEFLVGNSRMNLDAHRVSLRFELAGIKDKAVIIVSDTTYTLNMDANAILKKLISHEAIGVERKNKDRTEEVFLGTVIITGNKIWQSDDDTSGYRRRVLVIRTDRVAPEMDPALGDKLKAEISGLVVWALQVPDQLTQLSGQAEEISKVSAGEGLDPFGLKGWLSTSLYINAKESTALGATTEPKPRSLYESYLNYAEHFNLEQITPKKFGGILVEYLKGLGYKHVAPQRKKNGQFIKGVTLTKGKGTTPIKRTSSPTLALLKSTEPWEGFEDDLIKYKIAEDERWSGEVKVSEELVNLRGTEEEDTIKKADLEEIIIVHETPELKREPQPENQITNPEEAGGTKMKQLKGLQSWTEKDRMERTRETLADAFEEWENSSPGNPSLPDRLQKSTSLTDEPYSLAKELDREIAKIALVPTKFERIVKAMNEVSKEITEYCYTSNRIKDPEDRYYKHKCPINLLWPETYERHAGYARLQGYTYSTGKKSGGTIGFAKENLREKIFEKYENDCLPEDWAFVEMDMMAVHTGIFIGLLGKEQAPVSYACYISDNFWEEAIKICGDSIKKEELKQIIYSGMNGAKCFSKVLLNRTLKKEGMTNEELDKKIEQAKDNKLLNEVSLFQKLVGKKNQIYLPNRVEPYRGKVEEIEQQTKRSRYHEGLMSSRVLASHEVIFLAYLVEVAMTNRLGVPISLEHDGVLYLCRRTNRERLKLVLNETLTRISEELLGLKIQVKGKR